MNTTATRPLASILADLADFTVASTGTKAITLYHELEDAVRAQLAPLPEGEAERTTAEAEHTARTMAPPVPGVTRNAGYTVQAVYHVHDAERGLLEQWVVACEDAERGTWVTWNAYRQNGRLTYAAEPSAPARIPPCATEDSPGAAGGPCYWNARTRGNHEGRSFTTSPEGTAP
jgi:hypothetical protein